MKILIKKAFVTILIPVFAFGYTSAAFCDTIVLKSGKSVEGRIVDKQDECIKVDFDGIILTYFKDEVDRIERSPLAPVGPNKNKSFIWKAQGKNSKVYLLGSIHVGKEDLYPLNENIEKAFNESDALVVECDIGNREELNAKKLLEKAMYPPGDSIQNHLSPETFNLLKDKLASMGVNIVKVLSYKPWFLVLGFASLAYLSAGYSPELGIDSYLLNRARGVKKILELESVESQLNLFSNLTDKEQDALIYYTFSDKDKKDPSDLDPALLGDAWKYGDDEFIKETIGSEGKQEGFACVYEKIFTQRNLNMAARIQEFLEGNETYLVIIGVGHYLGLDSVIDILAKKGYNFERL